MIKIPLLLALLTGEICSTAIIPPIATSPESDSEIRTRVIKEFGNRIIQLKSKDYYKSWSDGKRTINDLSSEELEVFYLQRSENLEEEIAITLEMWNKNYEIMKQEKTTEEIKIKLVEVKGAIDRLTEMSELAIFQHEMILEEMIADQKDEETKKELKKMLKELKAEHP